MQYLLHAPEFAPLPLSQGCYNNKYGRWCSVTVGGVGMRIHEYILIFLSFTENQDSLLPLVLRTYTNTSSHCCLSWTHRIIEDKFS